MDFKSKSMQFFQRDECNAWCEADQHKTFVLKKYKILIYFVFRNEWPIISLDEPLFLSWDRAEPFEAL